MELRGLNSQVADGGSQARLARQITRSFFRPAACVELFTDCTGTAWRHHRVTEVQRRARQGLLSASRLAHTAERASQPFKPTKSLKAATPRAQYLGLNSMLGRNMAYLRYLRRPRSPGG